MAEQFDPDKYLAEKTGQEFDPDQYLASKTGEQPPEPGMLESAALGAGESASFGALPKMAGAAASPIGAGKSLLELLTPPGLYEYSKEGDEDVAKYEAGKKKMLSRLEKASGANPLSYSGGALGGGALLALATAGLGEAPAAANLGSKVAQGAKLGAGYGGLQGLLGSEAPTLGGKIQSGIGGAGVGAATGAAVPLIGAGLKALVPKKIKSSLQMGSEGTNILTEEGRRQVEDTERYLVAKQIYNQLLGKEEGIAPKIGREFESLNQQFGDQIVDANEYIGRLKGLINTLDDRLPQEAANKKTLSNLISNFENPVDQYNVAVPPTAGGYELPAKDLLTLKRGLKDRSKFGEGLSSQQGEYVAGQGAAGLSKLLEENIPELEKANERYHTMQEHVLSPLGIKGADEAEGIKKLQRQLFNVDAQTSLGSTTRNAVTEAMEALRTIDPDLANNLDKTIKTTGTRIQTAREAGNEPFPTAGNFLKDIKSVGIKASNVVGLGHNHVSKAFAKMPSTNLKKIGTSLLNSDKDYLNKLGNILVKASEKDEIGRNAMIFTLMQNDAYRHVLSGLLGIQEP